MLYRYLLGLWGLLLLPLGGRAQSGEPVLAGTVQTEAGTALPGATVFLKGTYQGNSTNQEGRFVVRVPRFPAVLVVAFVGYESLELTLNQPDNNLQVIMRPTAVLSQTVVAASREAETIALAPVTVDKLNQRQFGQLTAPDLVAGLARLPGVDISQSSMLTTSFSTRGFNQSRAERVIQLADYMDTQLPSLSTNFGNLLGTPVLDVASVELVHGPASALYGANAFNGVLLTNSRDAFLDPGLSVRLRAGSRDMLDGQLRYAVKLGERVAFKLSGGAFIANDFVANNFAPTSSLIEPNNRPAGSGFGYDAVNRYGDVGLTYPTSPTAQGYAGPLLAGKTVFAPGYSEADLVADDNKTHSYKVMPSLAVLLSNSVKATLDYRYTNSTTTYQNATRYRFIDSGAHQQRLQVEGRDWVVRAFSTQDYSGGRDPQTAGSYNLGLLGPLLLAENVGGGSPLNYGQRYFRTYAGAYNAAFVANGGNADAAALTAQAAAATAAPLLQPGTQEFNTARDRIIRNSTPGQGARVVLRSVMSEASGQYNFKSDVANLIVGAAYRDFRLGSDGSVFGDRADADRIRNYEFGAYAEATKNVFDERLRLALAGRLDQFQNFGTAFSPRASLVYTAGADKDQNFRVSYSRAFRAPTQTDQYLRFDVGRAILLGNVGQGFQGYVRNPATGGLAEYQSAALQLEEIDSFEGGYRAQITRNFFVDANYFYSFYNNFIATQNFIGNRNGTRPTGAELAAAAPFNFGNPALDTRIIQISTNVDQRVRSQGAGLTVGYTVSPELTLLGNYSFNDLVTKDFRAGTQSFFNTPRHKFNLGFDGLALARRLSYNVSYRWADSFIYESAFATGTVPTAQSFDAQIGFLIKPLRTTLQAGATNLFDTNNFSVYGAPSFGRIGYFGLLFTL